MSPSQVARLRNVDGPDSTLCPADASAVDHWEHRAWVRFVWAWSARLQELGPRPGRRQL